MQIKISAGEMEIYMKTRDVCILVSVILAVISISAAVAYFVHRLLGSKKDCNYIECDCEPDCL